MDGGDVASWPGVVRVVLNFTRTIGDGMVNVLTVQRDASGTPPNATEIDAVLVATRDRLWDDTGNVNDLRAIITNDVTLATITGTSMDVGNFGLQRTLSVAQAGSDAAGVLAPQIAAVVTHRTAIASRRARGRTYIGGLTETSAPLSTSAYPTLSAAAQAKLNTAFASWQFELSGLTTPYNHVVASVPAATTYDITQSIARSKLYTQRRRN